MEAKPIYKTADDLKIEQWEHDGLVALVGPLSRGEIALDMDYPTNPYFDCGSVCCIGGHMAVAHGMTQRVAIYDYVERADGALRTLFYPEACDDQIGLYSIRDGKLAARAIVNFLVTGDPQWDAVMSEG